MQLTLKQLNCLIAVADTRHFRRAAEQCGISQPSLSLQIQNLEEVLGTRLVERDRSHVTLSPIGREIVQRARRITDETQSIIDFAAGARQGLSGTIRLGSKPTLGPYLLPHIVSTLHSEYKDLRLYVREGAPHNLEHELQIGLHDLVLSQVPASSSDHEEELLFREPLYLAMAADHPLAGVDNLHVNGLKGIEILTLGANYHLHDQIYSICNDYGAKIQRDYEGTSLDALRLMVGMGMGATFLPALYVHSEINESSEIIVKTLKGRSITRSVGLIWRKSTGKAKSYKKIGEIIRTVARSKFPDLIVD